MFIDLYGVIIAQKNWDANLPPSKHTVPGFLPMCLILLHLSRCLRLPPDACRRVQPGQM